ncbi:MAG: sodium-dependent transporter [Pseudoflavonifractor sp.]
MKISKSSAEGGKFTSSAGFILAAVGSAVGMGNIWLFPYRMAECGGAAFLIPYFIFVALFSYAGLSGEFALGRLTGAGTMGSFDYALKSRGKKGGKLIGVLPLLGVLGIAIGYSVVVGWVLRYTAGAVTGSILASDSQAFFDAMAVSFGSIPWHFLAIALTVLILVLGVSTGIEKISKFMMPAFFLLFLIIAVRVAFLPNAMEGYLYLLVPKWEHLANPMTWIYAMGQAFFSLSINGAGMLIYGSYMKKSENIIRQSVFTAILDTCAALLAAFAIIPAVFSFGIPLDRGPSLLFVTMPKIFALMPAGRLFAILFFVSVFFAGITSLMNMLEACSEALGRSAKLSRTISTTVIGGLVFAVSVFLESLSGMGSWMDLITIYIAPFGAVLGAIFIYWVLGLDPIQKELMLGRKKPMSRAFGIIAKYIYVPLAAVVVLFGILYGGIG